MRAATVAADVSVHPVQYSIASSFGGLCIK